MNCAVHTDTPATAYCRTCGKALCENCKRDVMGAIYCEPCIAVRLQGAQPQATASPAATIQGTPSPGVAMLLGFIPGVGAMYNGQFMKGFIHVMIFVLLIVGVGHHWFFGLLIPFFVLYMAFDAYKTAEARRLGLPAPDLMGLDRAFGLHENHNAPPPPGTTEPISSASDPALAPDPGAVAGATQAHTDHVPVGAMVLIILGVVLLVGNLTDLNLHRYWPLILLAIGFWMAYKRLSIGPREAR